MKISIKTKFLIPTVLLIFISASMSQSALAVEDITSEIADVSQSADGLFDNSHTVQKKAEELSGLAIELDKLVDQFIVEKTITGAS